MHFFGMMFWVVVLILFFAARRRRRWERWAMMGPRGYGPSGGWWNPRDWYGRTSESEVPDRRLKQGDQQEYIDSLETRVTQLEERLDFTERLLAERRESPGANQVS